MHSVPASASTPNASAAQSRRAASRRPCTSRICACDRRAFASRGAAAIAWSSKCSASAKSWRCCAAKARVDNAAAVVFSCAGRAASRPSARAASRPSPVRAAIASKACASVSDASRPFARGSSAAYPRGSCSSTVSRETGMTIGGRCARHGSTNANNARMKSRWKTDPRRRRCVASPGIAPTVQRWSFRRTCCLSRSRRGSAC